MARLRFFFTIALIFSAAGLSACTKSESKFGLDGIARSQAGTEGAGDRAQPGTQREFSERAGDTIRFTTDNTEINLQGEAILVAQSRWLNQYTQYPILIEGHADERGTREYNLALGAKRAAAVKRFLIARGVEPRRISIVTYGKEHPVAVCANISCWSQNRRAVTVLKSDRVARR
jgi:peptidoglycan-associated lipoprotein